ncbi:MULTISPECIES: hypothetical protein [unclassified Microcoleus]|uniref:hypothetical protein n=1 Tax=unclassified Microcoleus TaxID=2642155 RepID=UPI002FD337D9
MGFIVMGEGSSAADFVTDVTDGMSNFLQGVLETRLLDFLVAKPKIYRRNRVYFAKDRLGL